MMRPDQRLLAFAIGVSLLFHALLLSVRFISPESFRFRPLNTGLEIVLVNAHHDTAPLQAEALAQANLEGGGNAEAGRARSPLPNMNKTADGAQLEMQRRRVAELEQEQKRLLAQLSERRPESMPVTEAVNKPGSHGKDVRSVEEILQMARREAEIARDVSDYNKRPLKTQLTPSTREVAHAMYYTALQKKIEQVGTLHFPQQDGKKIYGELIVYIPIFQDGSLYDKEGGPRIERSSGNAALDAAAIAILRRAAPFGRFPGPLQKTGQEQVWEIITRFNFTHEQTLETGAAGRGE